MKATRVGFIVVTMIATACAGAHRDIAADDSVGLGSTDAGGEACPLECSLDFRSVVRSCDGAIVQTCAPELGCAEGACIDACQATATAKSSLGCEFYLQPPPASQGLTGSCYAAYLVNAWTVPITFALSLGGQALDLHQSVYHFSAPGAPLEPFDGPIPPGDAVVVFLSETPSATQNDHTSCPSGVRPATDQWLVPNRTGQGSSFHLTTSAPVSAASIYPFGGALSYFPSATLLLPVATWGTQHLIVDAWERIAAGGTVGAGGIPGAQLVASEDGTELTIVPTADIQDGANVVGSAKGVAATYALSKGQFLQLSQDVELSGSTVSSNKPISIFGAHACMFIPSNVAACDTAQQQLPSFEQWGNEYVAVRYRGRSGDTESSPYRIVAAFADTELTYEPTAPPGAPSVMNAGDVVTFSTGDPFVVRSQDANHPFYLAAYMTGGDVPGASRSGDPEFVNVIPAGQYLSSYTFFADPTYTETSLVVVRQKTSLGFADVTIDCAGGPLDGWTPVGTSGMYEYRRVDLERGGGPGESFDGGTCTVGLQHMQSNGPFTATLWGWATYASYAYPGGMAQRKLVTQPLIDVH